MSNASRVIIGGRQLRCQHCGRDGFRVEKTTLDRIGLGFLQIGNLLWGHHATMYVCADCGFLHWFFDSPGVEHEVVDRPGQGGG